MRTSPSAIYTLSLHDALPISEFVQSAFVDGNDQADGDIARGPRGVCNVDETHLRLADRGAQITTVGHVFYQTRRVLLKPDRKSTRLNSSHLGISYAVFCLKKK